MLGQQLGQFFEGLSQFFEGFRQPYRRFLNEWRNSGHRECVNCIVIHGDQLYSGSSDRDVRVWSLDHHSCTRILRAHTEEVRSLVVMPLATPRVASASADKHIILWPVCPPTDQGAAQHEDGDVHVAEAVRAASATLLHGHTDGVRELIFDADELFLYSCADDGEVRQWDVENVQDWSCVRSFRANDYPVSTMVTTFGRLVSVCGDVVIRVWQPWSRYLPNDPLGPAGGDRLALAGDEDTQATPIAQLSRVHVMYVTCIVADNRYVCSGDNSGVIIVWDLAGDLQQVERRILNQHSNAVQCLQLLNRDSEQAAEQGVHSAPSPILCSGSKDCSVRLWRVDTGECYGVYSLDAQVQCMNLDLVYSNAHGRFHKLDASQNTTEAQEMRRVHRLERVLLCGTQDGDVSVLRIAERPFQDGQEMAEPMRIFPRTSRDSSRAGVTALALMDNPDHDRVTLFASMEDGNIESFHVNEPIEAGRPAENVHEHEHQDDGQNRRQLLRQNSATSVGPRCNSEKETMPVHLKGLLQMCIEALQRIVAVSALNSEKRSSLSDWCTVLELLKDRHQASVEIVTGAVADTPTAQELMHGIAPYIVALFLVLFVLHRRYAFLYKLKAFIDRGKIARATYPSLKWMPLTFVKVLEYTIWMASTVLFMPVLTALLPGDTGKMSWTTFYCRLVPIGMYVAFASRIQFVQDKLEFLHPGFIFFRWGFKDCHKAADESCALMSPARNGMEVVLFQVSALYAFFATVNLFDDKEDLNLPTLYLLCSLSIGMLVLALTVPAYANRTVNRLNQILHVITLVSNIHHAISTQRKLKPGQMKTLPMRPICFSCLAAVCTPIAVYQLNKLIVYLLARMRKRDAPSAEEQNAETPYVMFEKPLAMLSCNDAEVLLAELQFLRGHCKNAERRRALLCQNAVKGLTDLIIRYRDKLRTRRDAAAEQVLSSALRVLSNLALCSDVVPSGRERILNAAEGRFLKVLMAFVGPLPDDMPAGRLDYRNLAELPAPPPGYIRPLGELQQSASRLLMTISYRVDESKVTMMDRGAYHVLEAIVHFAAEKVLRGESDTFRTLERYAGPMKYATLASAFKWLNTFARTCRANVPGAENTKLAIVEGSWMVGPILQIADYTREEYESAARNEDYREFYELRKEAVIFASNINDDTERPRVKHEITMCMINVHRVHLTLTRLLSTEDRELQRLAANGIDTLCEVQDACEPVARCLHRAQDAIIAAIQREAPVQDFVNRMVNAIRHIHDTMGRSDSLRKLEDELSRVQQGWRGRDAENVAPDAVLMRRDRAAEVDLHRDAGGFYGQRPPDPRAAIFGQW